MHKTKVTWNTAHGSFKFKKEAQEYADKMNLKARASIEKFIGQNGDKETVVIRTAPMTIQDINGQKMTVTNLEKAIEQARDFKDLTHDPPIPTDADQQAYWQDIYEKLLMLKAQTHQF
nr:hypothetical protein [Pedobacter sp. ASV2]